MPGYHPGNSRFIITVPTDKRPISGEYLSNLVNMGGDYYHSIDRNLLDAGPNGGSYGSFKWGFAKSSLIRANLYSLMGCFDPNLTTVILNTPSYINGGLVGSRMPDRYNEVSNALYDIDTLTSSYSEAYYILHAPMPRTIPDPRFDWPGIRDHGLKYFYNIHKGVNDSSNDENFDQLLLEWGYVSDKLSSGYSAEPWETMFLNYFYPKYHSNAASEFKRDGISYVSWYHKLYVFAAGMITALIYRIRYGTINELVIGLDDITVPSFIEDNKNEPWVLKDRNNNIIKFSWELGYLNKIKEYHTSLFGRSSVRQAEIGNDEAINYIAGVDEIPQMIYARDLTRRTGFATKFVVDYCHDPNPNLSKNYQGPYDNLKTSDVIKQRLNFVLKRGLNHFDAKVFRLFIHCSNAEGPLKENYFTKDSSNMPGKDAMDFARSIFEHQYGSSTGTKENVGLLELGSFGTDLALFDALGMIPGHMRTQLCCYSSWNTIGNAAGLGIAQAQVFGIIDYYNATEDMIRHHTKLLAQRLIEDALYNTFIKKSEPQSLYTGIMPPDKHESVALDTYKTFTDPIGDIKKNKPSGMFYVMDYLTDKKYPIRIGYKCIVWRMAFIKPYRTPTLSELYDVTGHPWNRTFECIIETHLSL